MAIVSPNLALSIWNLVTDPYSHEELARNWAKVDQHDHTAGKGLPITTSAIADASVTAPKIAPGAIPEFVIEDGSITGTKLADNTVTTAKIGDGQVTTVKLAAGLQAPIGSVFMWPNASAPAGYLLCNDQPHPVATYPILAGICGNIWGTDVYPNFNVPDLRGRIVAGKGQAGAVNALAQAGGDTGIGTRKPNHTHGKGTLAVPDHHHNMQQHSHYSAYPAVVGGSGASRKVRVITPDSTFVDAFGSSVGQTGSNTSNIGVTVARHETTELDTDSSNSDTWTRYWVESGPPMANNDNNQQNSANNTSDTSVTLTGNTVSDGPAFLVMNFIIRADQ